MEYLTPDSEVVALETILSECCTVAANVEG